MRSTSSNRSHQSIISGANLPSRVKYRVCASRQYCRERSPSPSSKANASSTSSKRRFVNSMVLTMAFGTPCPSRTTIILPTSAESRPWLSAQQVAHLVPDNTSSRSLLARSGPSPKENVSRSRQSIRDRLKFVSATVNADPNAILLGLVDRTRQLPLRRPRTTPWRARSPVGD